MSNLLQPLDIGHGHILTPYTRSGDPGEAVYGYLDEHPDARDPSKRCGGGVAIQTIPGDPHPVVWDLVQADPLTLSPSVLCLTCGDHGWVRDGKWVPA